MDTIHLSKCAKVAEPEDVNNYFCQELSVLPSGCGNLKIVFGANGIQKAYRTFENQGNGQAFLDSNSTVVNEMARKALSGASLFNPRIIGDKVVQVNGLNPRAAGKIRKHSREMPFLCKAIGAKSSLFVTLTLPECGEDSFLKKAMSDLFKRIKRKYGAIYYVWVIEVQGQRFIKRGERVPHVHIEIAGIKYLDHSWLRSMWIEILKKRGMEIPVTQKGEYVNTDVQRARKPGAYMTKYLTKQEDSDEKHTLFGNAYGISQNFRDWVKENTHTSISDGFCPALEMLKDLQSIKNELSKQNKQCKGGVFDLNHPADICDLDEYLSYKQANDIDLLVSAHVWSSDIRAFSALFQKLIKKKQQKLMLNRLPYRALPALLSCF